MDSCQISSLYSNAMKNQNRRFIIRTTVLVGRIRSRIELDALQV